MAKVPKDSAVNWLAASLTIGWVLLLIGIPLGWWTVDDVKAIIGAVSTGLSIMVFQLLHNYRRNDH